VASIEIADGSPIWLSPSIIPSRDLSATTVSGPVWATPAQGSTDVFVYVKVENATADEVGSSCPIGQWSEPVAPLTQLATTGIEKTDSKHGYTFSALAAGDKIVRDTPLVAGGSLPGVSFGFPASGRRVWGWSQDGHFFAYAYGPIAGDVQSWRLKVVTLDGAVRADGTPLTLLTVLDHPALADPPIRYDHTFILADFNWIGSEGLFTRGTVPAPPTGTAHIVRVVACFKAAPTPRAVETQVTAGGQWRYRASPCGSQIAYMEESPASAQEIVWVSTRTGSTTQSRDRNIARPVQTDGATPTITTLAHTSRGVVVQTGSAGPIKIDDPDGTARGGLEVRVEASTLPDAHLGVLPVGAAAVGPISTASVNGPWSWAQVPNDVGWDRQSESHWCLLAQAYSPEHGIPIAWNPLELTDPTDPFPAQALLNCAQRNIDIGP
jgi:hypothetical protein